MNTQVCIIGGGVIGCATAWALARAGQSVRVLERDVLGAESSWAGAGLLTPLLPWHYKPAVTNLIDWSLDLYPEWVSLIQAESGVDPEYGQSGMLVLPPYDLDPAQAWAQSHGQSAALSEIEAREIEPQLNYVGRALWMPGVAQVRNPRLMRALRGALLKMGVTLQEQTPVAGWQVAAGRVDAVQTTTGLISAETFIVASGAWSQAVLGEWGHSLPIKPMRGQIVLFRATPGRLKSVLYQDGVYVIPRADGHILVGSTLEDVGFDKAVTPAARTDLSQRAVTLLPWLKDTPVVGHWSGLRPGSLDNVPTIGRHPALENLYINTGHFRYGVSMAPASAALLVNLMLGERSPINSLDYAFQN